MQLTQAQEQVITALRDGKNVFMTGPGGTGKSTIIKHVVENFSDVGVTALTGSAAVLIRGTTTHSFLSVGLGKGTVPELVRRVRKSKKKRNWTATRLLVVDEISMMSAELFDKLNKLGKIIRDTNLPFGGMQLLFSGDFLQLPCIGGNFCFTAETWDECIDVTIHLTEIIRQKDGEFQEILTRARFGKITDDDVKILSRNEGAEGNDGIIPTKIMCKRADVDELNKHELDKLPGEVYEYELEIEKPRNLEIDPMKHCNAEMRLNLSIGAQVMLVVNLHVESGLVNGSRGVVINITETGLPIVKFKNGHVLPIQYHEWTVTEDNNKVVASIFQIPLRLAWAITAHKSQGATLDAAEIDLDGVFECGQAYVALSRVKTLANLTTYNLSKQSFKANQAAIDFYAKIV